LTPESGRMLPEKIWTRPQRRSSRQALGPLRVDTISLMCLLGLHPGISGVYYAEHNGVTDR